MPQSDDHIGAIGHAVEPGDEAAVTAAAETMLEPLPVSILVVDDDSRSLYALERTLSQSGLNIVTARSGEEALKRLLREDFALILLDIRMPGMDGYETASVIRTRGKTRQIPIIFLTAMDRDDVQMFRGYTAGAVDYVFKPVDPLILQSKVSVFVELYRRTEEVRREERLKRLLERQNFQVKNEKLRAEQALRASEERQSLIIDSLPIAFYVADLSDSFAGPRFVGDSIERLTGIPAPRFESEPDYWKSRIHDADRERVLGEVRHVGTDGAFVVEYRWQCADGTYRYFLDRSVRVQSPDGDGHELHGMWLDVTEQRQMHEQLVHAQKMDAVGRLTGGIAHDFSNMLTALLGNLDLLRRSVEHDGRAARWAGLAIESAQRCADLTQRLLYFARRQPLQPTPLDVNALVTGMKGIVDRALDESVRVVFRLESDLPQIYVDRSQLESALLNLVINARDAMPEGGEVVIETSRARLVERYRGRGFDADPGDYVLMGVTDTGSGMDSEVAERVFEPFFTTKEPGSGTGLGLAMVHTFIRQCDGFVRIDSEIGRGTSVRLYIKIAQEHSVRSIDRAETGDELPIARENETILLVEDDQDVLRASAEALRRLGYFVLEADSAFAALDVLSNADAVNLLFSDIAMPGGMSGLQLAKEVCRRDAAIKVLLTSGYASRVCEGDGDAGAFIHYLRKPYRDYELARAVRSVIDGSAEVVVDR